MAKFDDTLEGQPIRYADDVVSHKRINKIVQQFKDKPYQAMNLLLQLPKEEYVTKRKSSQLNACGVLGIVLRWLVFVMLLCSAWWYSGIVGMLFSSVAAVVIAACFLDVSTILYLWPGPEECNAGFYQKKDVEHLYGSLWQWLLKRPLDVTEIRKEMTSLIEKWANSNPKNHSRHTLFKVIHGYGQFKLARGVLQGTFLPDPPCAGEC